MTSHYIKTPTTSRNGFMRGRKRINPHPIRELLGEVDSKRFRTDGEQNESSISDSADTTDGSTAPTPNSSPNDTMSSSRYTLRPRR